jgi:hypothetical protein
MGGRGSSSMSGSAAAWKKQTAMEQAMAIATAAYDRDHSHGVSVEDSIPDWVLEKKLSQGESYAFRTGDGAFIKRETEKAYLIASNSDYGQVSFWMPKSWMSSPEKVRSDSIQSEARYLVGQNYNHYLKQVASDNGVKLGNVRRTAGIQDKLTKKGVQFFDKATFSGSKGWEVAYREETKLKDGRTVVSVWK